MNRAALLLSVLKDGKPHSRQDVFERVGFMLTNNAAAELRAQGYTVEHSVEKGVHVYRLLGEGSAEGGVGEAQRCPDTGWSHVAEAPEAETQIRVDRRGADSSRRDPSPSSLSKIGAAVTDGTPAGESAAAPMSSPGCPIPLPWGLGQLPLLDGAAA